MQLDVRPSDVKYGFRVYCSLACAAKYRRGRKQRVRPEKRPHNFKGYRRAHAKGYVLARAPDDHPRPSSVAENGIRYVLEHRLVMERHLGRFLHAEEVVHHIDENPANNRLSNLALFPNDAAHRRHHALLKRRK